jgi:hypothetical protein
MSFDPLLFLGIPLFLSEVCVLIQQIKVIIMRIRSWLWLIVKVVIEYKASVATILTMVVDALRDKAYIIPSGLHGLYLIKNLYIINEMLHVSERKVEYMIMSGASFKRFCSSGKITETTLGF